MELLRYRLRTAFFTLPDLSGWLVTFLLFLVFALLAYLILRKSKLFTFSLIRLRPSQIGLLIVIAVFTPSLPEELLYRVLLLPHPSEGATPNVYLTWSVTSLVLFILAHPLLAWGAWPWARAIFYRPAFLLIVALLGVACTLAYYATGSLWAPVAIHWATIVGWKLFFGGPDFNLGQR